MAIEYYECVKCGDNIHFDRDDVLESEVINDGSDHEYTLVYEMDKINSVVEHMLECQFVKVKMPWQ